MARQRKAAQQAEDTPAQELVPETTAPAAAGDATSPAVEAGQSPQPQGEREAGDDTGKSWVQQHASVILDPEAGVKFHFDYEHHKAIITFNEKPTPELLAVAKPIMTPRGFHWDNESLPVGWAKKIRFDSREDERREAKKTFYEVANAVRQHKGLPPRSFGQSVPF